MNRRACGPDLPNRNWPVNRIVSQNVFRTALSHTGHHFISNVMKYIMYWAETSLCQQQACLLVCVMIRSEDIKDIIIAYSRKRSYQPTLQG